MVSAIGESPRNNCSLSWPAGKQQFHKQGFFLTHMNSVGQEFGEDTVEMVSLYSEIAGTTPGDESISGAYHHLEASSLYRPSC